jgi:Alcohol dehydrogenase, class IV
LEFGPGKLTLVPSIVKTLSPSGLVLVLSDKGVSQTGAPAKVVEALRNEGYTVSLVDSVPPEPSTHDLDAVAAGLKGNAAAIVAIGGGSVMDAAKILAVLTGKGWGTVELAERGVPGRGIPTVMIPTTAGTGSESTPNAIVLFPEKNLKVGIVSPYFMPDRVVLDPELTLGLPPNLTASTGVDAFCHLLECFISKKANPMSDMMAREGMRLLLPALPLVYNNGTDLEARSATLRRLITAEPASPHRVPQLFTPSPTPLEGPIGYPTAYPTRPSWCLS